MRFERTSPCRLRGADTLTWPMRPPNKVRHISEVCEQIFHLVQQTELLWPQVSDLGFVEVPSHQWSTNNNRDQADKLTEDCIGIGSRIRLMECLKYKEANKIQHSRTVTHISCFLMVYIFNVNTWFSIPVLACFPPLLFHTPDWDNQLVRRERHALTVFPLIWSLHSVHSRTGNPLKFTSTHLFTDLRFATACSVFTQRQNVLEKCDAIYICK